MRIAPGDSLCVDIQVLVPESLAEGDRISFNGIIDAYTYDYGGLALGGSGTGALSGSMDSGITLSEYYGTAQADQDLYADDDTVTITGQAIDRLTGLPLAATDLKIGFYMRGFKWYEDVVTDESGKFSFEYVPGPGVSGEFTVWSAHPDVFDVIDQDSFTFYRMYASPSQATIRSSKADALEFSISLINPGDLPITDFSLDFRAFTLDTDSTEIPEAGIQGEAVIPEGFSVQPGETKRVTLRLIADADAPDEANVVYTLVSGQGASASMTGTVSLLPAVPVLNITQARRSGMLRPAWTGAPLKPYR